MGPSEERFVSRAGLKLAAALDAFGLDVTHAVCADFGCNVGGFTECLLRRGASKVYSLDTGYGELAWTLRKDPRVAVMERTNALYCSVPEPVNLVTIDVAWTPQELIVPAAIKWLKAAGEGIAGGQVVSLLKPHYEMAHLQGRRPHRPLTPEQCRDVCDQVCQRLGRAGCCVRALMQSVLIGKGGNLEFLLWVVPSSNDAV